MHGSMNVKFIRLLCLVCRNSLVYTNTIVMTSDPEMEFVLREAKPYTKDGNTEEFMPAVT